jgi:hypothetical protein
MKTVIGWAVVAAFVAFAALYPALAILAAKT